MTNYFHILNLIINSSDSKFLQNYDQCTKDTLFEYSVELKDKVLAKECTYRTTQTKLEIKLMKLNSAKWNSLFKERTTEKQVTDKINEISLNNKIAEQRPVKIMPPKVEQVVRGPFYGHTGLVNLGNTCYINATLQCLANLTDIRDFFLGKCFKLNQKSINLTFFRPSKVSKTN